jgi:uncharacterized protein (DUF697 family)/GTP-binding protein EngB required for normal cell division
LAREVNVNRGNVLVIGNSGVGKSTLINSVLGDDCEKKAITGGGTSGTTKKLEIYESQTIPFRVIDSVGFEPGLLQEYRAINAVKKWSRDSAKDGNEDNKINVIWFCVDGTSRKLFPKAIQDLSRATSMWESIPVIVVITKSYSVPERQENIDLVNNAFAKQKRFAKNLRKVVPVVAATYLLNETAFAAPEGITDLVDVTNEVMPEGLKAGSADLYNFKLKRKAALAQSIVGASTVAGTVVGAIPIPIADALILSPVEVAEINALAQLYDISKDADSKQFLNSIVEAGTVSVAAKAAIGTLKAVPGIALAADVLNAVIAGAIVAAIGEGSVRVFEKVYRGEKNVADIDWVKQFMESELSNQFVDKVSHVLEDVSAKGSGKDLGKYVSALLVALFAPGPDKKGAEI